MTLEQKRAYRLGYKDGIKNAEKHSKKQNADNGKTTKKQVSNLYIDCLRNNREVI